MPSVYVVQEPIRKSAVDGRPVPLFDLAPAREYGELKTCLDWSDTRAEFDPEVLLDKLYEVLKNYTDDDYLLMTGNPTAMALAAIVASDINDGRIKLLVWTRNGAAGYYREVTVSLYTGE